MPLYAGAREAAPQARGSGHPGLWWDKFCNRWLLDWSDLIKPDKQTNSGGGKQDWIGTLVGKVGDERQLAEMNARRAAMLAKFGQKPIKLVLQAPFVTGTGLDHPVENGFLWHHSLGVPYLPGSGVKGLVRAWAERILMAQGGPEDWKPVIPDWDKHVDKGGEAIENVQKGAIDRIFGPRAREGHAVGSVIVLDALPMAPVELTMEVMTPHYQPWYQATDPATKPPADWYDPTPIPFLAVKPGATFAFALLPNPNGDATQEQAKDDIGAVEAWLKDALTWLGAGAKTAVGFGRFGEPPGAVPEKKDPDDGKKVKADPDLVRQFPKGHWVETPDGDGEVVGHVAGAVDVYLDEQGVRRRYPPSQLKLI